MLPRPFIVFSDDWGRWPSSSQHLFRHVGRRRDVLWVETFGMRAPRPTAADVRRTVEKVASWAGREPDEPWAVVPERVIRFAPPVPPRPGRVLAAAVRRRVDTLGWSTEPVVLVTVPTAAGAVGRLGEAASVYYRVDDFSRWPGYAHKAIERGERRLAERVDGVLYTASALAPGGFAGAIRRLDHGVDVAHFSRARERPPELDRDGPVLLFAGRIDERIDATLLRGLPGTVVLVGRAAGPVPSGVVHLPEVPYRDLPAWLAAADVLLLPYRRGGWTDTIQPLKLREYVASGTPVAATALPEVVRADLGVHVASGPADFAAAVQSALDDGRSARERRSAVAAHTWVARASELLAFCDSLA